MSKVSIEDGLMDLTGGVTQRLEVNALEDVYLMKFMIQVHNSRDILLCINEVR